MATQLQRPTAKIYAFPAGGRGPQGRIRELRRPASISRLPDTERTVRVQNCSSWYHEEAVEDEN